MCGAVAEWSKALAWKVSIRQNRIVGSNPTRSANYLFPIIPCQPKQADIIEGNTGFPVSLYSLPFLCSPRMMWEIVWERITWAS